MVAAYAAHPERFIGAIPQPPALPNWPTVLLRATKHQLQRSDGYSQPSKYFYKSRGLINCGACRLTVMRSAELS